MSGWGAPNARGVGAGAARSSRVGSEGSDDTGIESLLPKRLRPRLSSTPCTGSGRSTGSRAYGSVADGASLAWGSTQPAQADGVGPMLRRRSSSVQFGPGALGWTNVSGVSVPHVLRHLTHDDFVESGDGDGDGYGGGGGGGGEAENGVLGLSGSSAAPAELPSLVLRPRKKKRRRRTKIVCALGPSSRTVPQLLSLLEAGMNVARLNFSHGDHEYHLGTLQNLKEAVALRRAAGFQCHCAVLMDTKGPEIRTGFLKNHEPVELRLGQELEICTDYTLEGTASRISCSYEHLCSSVEAGGTILIADGSISCKVLAVGETSVRVRVENDATLEERKNMNLPGVSIRLPGITEKDRYDLENFALKYDVDIVSGSFVRTAANVRALRECLREKGKRIRVHAKIESVEALRNIHEIIAEADGIHVSRGDLGMELPLSKLFLAQKAVIHWANLAGKPVVTSTQMLDSMTKHPRPTNAECSDVANAVLDGTDCVMLSAETAKGLYPRESVLTMTRIIAEAELALDYESSFTAIREAVLGQDGVGHVPIMEALASSAVESAMDVDAPLIVLISETGRLATLVAKYRPLARILVVTGNEMTARQMSVSRGVNALMMDSDILMRPSEAWIEIARYALRKQWVKVGDRAILVMSPIGLEPKKLTELREKAKHSNRLIDCVEIRIVNRPRLG